MSLPNTTESKLQAARELRQEGNTLFKEGEYKKAIVKYRHVFAYVNGLMSNDSQLLQYKVDGPDLDASQEQEVKEIKAACYGNIALAYFKMNLNEKALTEIDRALAIDAENAKFLCRKGQICLALQDFENSKKYLMACVNISPQDRTVRKILDEWKQQYTVWNAARNEETKRLFEGKLG